MRFRVQPAILCWAILMHTGCGNSSVGSRADVTIRVENASDKTLDSVVVWVGHREDYGRIPPHSVSSYRKADGAYSASAMWITSGEDRWDEIVTDNINETPLPPGRYTYRVKIDPNPHGGYDLTVRCVTKNLITSSCD
jgi:hypothetical protein